MVCCWLPCEHDLLVPSHILQAVGWHHQLVLLVLVLLQLLVVVRLQVMQLLLLLLVLLQLLCEHEGQRRDF
jgi:hypothetical protein